MRRVGSFSLEMIHHFPDARENGRKDFLIFFNVFFFSEKLNETKDRACHEEKFIFI